MNSLLVFTIFAFLAFNHVSVSALPFGISSLAGLNNGVVETLPESSILAGLNSDLLSNTHLIDGSSVTGVQSAIPADLVFSGDAFGPATLVAEGKISSHYFPTITKIKKGASKVRSYMPALPFSKYFKKPKEETVEEVFVEQPVVGKKFNIDPQVLAQLKTISALAAKHLGPLVPAGIGASVGAPIGAVAGATVGAVRGAQVGTNIAKQKTEIAQKIGKVASQITAQTIAAGKATLSQSSFGKAVSGITITPTKISIKAKGTEKVKTEKKAAGSKSIEASLKINHPAVGKQFTRIKLEQPGVAVPKSDPTPAQASPSSPVSSTKSGIKG